MDREDDRSQLSEEGQAELISREIEEATAATAGNSGDADTAAEKKLLSQMETIAEQARALPDARVRYSPALTSRSS